MISVPDQTLSLTASFDAVTADTPPIIEITFALRMPAGDRVSHRVRVALNADQARSFQTIAIDLFAQAQAQLVGDLSADQSQLTASNIAPPVSP